MTRTRDPDPDPGSEGTALRLARPKAARMSSGGVEGLLEAAASLSDGETPGTPTIGPGGIPSRSPRISGLLSAIGGEDMGSAAAEAAAAAERSSQAPGGVCAGAKGGPGGGGGAGGGQAHRGDAPAALNSVNHAAALAAALDPNAYAAAIAAFAKAAPVPAAPQFPGLNPQLLVAWMTAAGMAPQPQPAAHAASPWNPAAIQQLAAQLAAAQQQGAAASGSPRISPSEDEGRGGPPSGCEPRTSARTRRSEQTSDRPRRAKIPYRMCRHSPGRARRATLFECEGGRRAAPARRRARAVRAVADGKIKSKSRGVRTEAGGEAYQ